MIRTFADTKKAEDETFKTNIGLKKLKDDLREVEDGIIVGRVNMTSKGYRSALEFLDSMKKDIEAFQSDIRKIIEDLGE
jgi:hypothetical protein